MRTLTKTLPSRRAALFVASAALLCLLFLAGSAQALNAHMFSSSFGSAGSGAGQMSLQAFGSDPSSPVAGSGLAVDSITHDVYVADAGNHRIDEFGPDGTFVRAWGWGVADGITKAFQTCTLTCFAGIPGSSGGQFTTPVFIAVDNTGGASQGDVYVGDAGDELVSKFTATGGLIEAWGTKGQLDGSTSTAGSFGEIAGIAVDSDGTLIVINSLVQPAHEKSGLFKFAQDGSFSEEFEAAGYAAMAGLAVDSAGNLFKVNSGGLSSVEEITSSNGDVGKVTASEGATGVAVDTATGDLYVDKGGEIEHYAFVGEGIVSDAGAMCIVEPNHGCAATDTFGSGEVSGGAGVGVDPTTRAVFAADTGNQRIDVFDQIVLPDVTTEAASSVSQTAVTLRGTVNPDGTQVTGCRFEYGTELGVYSNTTACSQTLPLTGENPVPVSLGKSGLTANTTYHYRLAATNENGTSIGAEESFTTPASPGIDSESAEVKPAEKAGQTTATLRAMISPDGRETTYSFEYGETTSYGTSVPVPVGAVGAGEQSVSVPAAELTGLTVGTTYHYRVVATNEYGTTDGPDQTFTTLAAALIAESVSDVTATSATPEAQINPLGRDTTCEFQYAIDASFQASGYESSMLVPCPADLGEGEADAPTSVHLQGLTAGMVYHYRAVATNEVGTVDGPDQTFTTQATGGSVSLPDNRAWELVSPAQKHGALLEGIDAIPDEGGVIQAAADGSAISYDADTPTEAEPAGYSSNTQVLSMRGQAGWESHDLVPPHVGATGASIIRGGEYRFFSEDLSIGVVQPFGSFVACHSAQGVAQPCLSPDASEQTAFLHDNTTNAYTPLVTRADDTADPFQPFGLSVEVENDGLSCPPALYCGPEFVSASPDGSHVVLMSKVALTGTAIPQGSPQLYEWSGAEPASEQLQLVSVLPKGEGGGAPATGVSLGSQRQTSRGAISNDGSRVFFTPAGNTGLYMRDLVSKETLRLDVPEPECLSKGTCGQGVVGPDFQLASSDGSRVLFTDNQRLTADSGAGGASVLGASDLYECEIVEAAGEPRCALTDLTPRSASGESANAQREVLGASVDGSYIYFVADGALSGTGAKPGNCTATSAAKQGETCNLYMRHDGRTKLVAVLSGEDNPDWGHGELVVSLTARVSPDGHWLAFMSARELSGYDNRDAASGQPDEETYLYNAETGHISCASCDPTGARPFGVEYAPLTVLGDPNSGQASSPLVGGDRVWGSSTWLAADLPGWTPYSNKERAIYQSRYLSNSGRLFFNAHAGLVPADVNNTWDVYEYEPEGVPAGEHACTSATQGGGEVFKPARTAEVEGRKVEEGAGCTALISSGESADESAFLDASATGGVDSEGNEGGGDVFFLTTAKLASQDFDQSLDVYDAHECTTASPCISSPVTPPACTTEASCKPSPSQQPGIYGLPASATFSGAGNLVPSVVAPKAAVKKKTVKCAKAKKLSHGRCVKAKAKKKVRHVRGKGHGSKK